MKQCGAPFDGLESVASIGNRVRFSLVVSTGSANEQVATALVTVRA
jgi:hypothetical protein